MSACTFFGHRDTSAEIKPKLKQVIVDLIENKKVTMFYIGNNGAFDRMAREILKELRNKYNINYYFVLACIPQKSAYYDYSGTIYFDEFTNVITKIEACPPFDS